MTRTVYVFYNENEKFLDNMEKLDIQTENVQLSENDLELFNICCSILMPYVNCFHIQKYMYTETVNQE